MSRTYLSGNNSRGNTVTGMNATYSHLRGWNAGVRVQFAPGDKDEDSFAVYMTHGSNAREYGIYLGTVRHTPDGPAWEPADMNEILERSGK